MIKYLLLLLLCVPCYAGEISEPPISKDLPKDTSDYLQQLYNNFNNLQVVTTNPNGNRRGKYGDLVDYNNSGNHSVKICTSSPSGTTWSDIFISTSLSNVEVVNFSRNIAAGNGAVNYSCTKGTPKGFIFSCGLASYGMSVGMDDTSTKGVQFVTGTTPTYGAGVTDASILITDGTNTERGYVSAVTTNQFTITWTATAGSPSGTMFGTALIIY